MVVFILTTLCSKKVGKWLHTYQHDFPFVASSQTHQELDHSAKDLMARLLERVCSEAQEEERVVANVTEVYSAGRRNMMKKKLSSAMDVPCCKTLKF